MSVLLTSCLSWFVLICSLAVLLFYIRFKLIGSKYWRNRNVFQLDPCFLLGNNWEMLFFESVGFVHEKRYRRWKEKKLIGFWSFTTPSVLVTSPDIAKRMLVADFEYFMDRSTNADDRWDPLAGHLFNLKGAKWKNLRVKLTPTFSSGKMKMMFSNMVECGLEMQAYLSERVDAAKNPGRDLQEVFARYTTDVISSCAFGIETNCLKNPDSEFRRYGKKIFAPSFITGLRLVLANFFPAIRNALRVRIIPKDVSDFFCNIVRETIEYRERNNVTRNDFMDLLIRLKTQGSLKENGINDDSCSAKGTQIFTLSVLLPMLAFVLNHFFRLREADECKLTFNQVAAQAFVFFVAGFETSSTTLSFAFYELAMNPSIQMKLQAEIDRILRGNVGTLTYEQLTQMEYLDRVVQETLRKYPPLPIIGRKCTKEYKIPEMDVVLEKGVRIVIPVLGFQRDPEFFPEPHSFDPDRFSHGESRNMRQQFSYLPFGEGPRSCIGARFGTLQVKIGVVSILSEYNVEVSQYTPAPLRYNRSFLLSPAERISLNITKRRRQ